MINFKTATFALVLTSILPAGAAFAFHEEDDLYGNSSPVVKQRNAPIESQQNLDELISFTLTNILILDYNGNDPLYGEIETLEHLKPIQRNIEGDHPYNAKRREGGRPL